MILLSFITKVIKTYKKRQNFRSFLVHVAKHAKVSPRVFRAKCAQKVSLLYFAGRATGASSLFVNRKIHLLEGPRARTFQGFLLEGVFSHVFACIFMHVYA